MLEALISSKTRIKLLLRLFLNPEARAYLRGLAEEFNESTNAIRLELNRFEDAGMLLSSQEGNKKVFQANTQHPLYDELRGLVLKHTGLQQVIEQMIQQIGDLKKAYLTGTAALGKSSNELELVFVGKPDLEYLKSLVKRVEGLISKQIRYLIYSREEAESVEFDPNQYLLLWHE